MGCAAFARQLPFVLVAGEAVAVLERTTVESKSKSKSQLWAKVQVRGKRGWLLASSLAA